MQLNETQQAKQHLETLTEGMDVYFGGRVTERNDKVELVLSVFKLEDNTCIGGVTLYVFDKSEEMEIRNKVRQLEDECTVFFGKFVL